MDGAIRERPRKIELVMFSDMRPRLTANSLVKDVLHQHQTSLLLGATQTGKTFLALDIGLHIAAGIEWFGHRISEGAVVYLAAEAGPTITNRVVAWKQTHGYDLDDSDIPFAAVTQAIDLCHVESGDIEALIAAVRNAAFEQIALIIVDTVSRVLAGGDENSPGDMGAIVASLDRLRDEFRCHVLAVHHLGKDAGRGARGHSLLTANLDTIIEVERADKTNSVSTATITKQRDGATGTTMSFRLRAVELGRDEYGDTVTSCVVEPAEGAEKVTNKPRLRGKAAIALDLLRRAVDEAGESPPSNNHIPVAVRAVRIDLWRRYFYAASLEGSESQEAKKKAFQRASEALQAAAAIGAWDGWAWIVP